MFKWHSLWNIVSVWLCLIYIYASYILKHKLQHWFMCVFLKNGPNRLIPRKSCYI